MTSRQLAISVKGMRTKRGQFELAVPNLSVAFGQLTVLVGPNGSGKSTLLRSIDGTVATDGHIELAGLPVADISNRQRARLLAAVPQEFAVPFAYSARQLVAFGRAPHLGLLGQLGAQDRVAVDAALSTCDLVCFADRPVGDLSGGQRRRVALAMALAQQTPILLVDEPTAHLDIGRARWCWQQLAEFAAAGGAVLAAAHDLAAAAVWADRLVLLSAGQIKAQGTPTRVLTAANLRSVFKVDVTFDAPAGQLIVGDGGRSTTS